MRQTKSEYTNDRQQKWGYRCTLPQHDPFAYCVQVHGFSGTINSDYITHGETTLTEMGLASVAFNMRGALEKECTTYDLTPNTALSDMTHFFETIKQDPRLNHEKPSILGTSFGAYTSVRYAAELCRNNPHNPPLGHLVLQCAVPEPLKPFSERINREFMGFKYNQLLWKTVGYMPQKIMGDLQWISYKMNTEVNEINLYEVARDITCPVTLIHGEMDEYAPLTDIHRLKESMVNSPSVNLHVIKGAGHGFTKDQRQEGEIFMKQALMMTYPVLRAQNGNDPSASHMRVA